MKKTHTWAVVAVAAIVIIGGYFFITSDAGDTWWEQEWNPSDAEIIGKWAIEPILVTTTGERVPLKSVDPQSLWVRQGGMLVSSVDYVLKASVDVGTLPGAYTSVELDMTNLKTKMRSYRISNPTVWSEFSKTNWGMVNIPVGYDGTSGWVTVATYTVPTDVFACVDWLGFPLPNCGPWEALAYMTEGWDQGDWQWVFGCDGSVTYQGLNSETGEGDVNSAAIPGDIPTAVFIGEYSVSMSWDPSVSYT